MMKPADAIEFALRLKNQRMNVEAIHKLVNDLVNIEGVDVHRLIAAAKREPKRFLVVEERMIQLLPERMADRTGFFRENVREIHEALRLMPFGVRFPGLELALIYALATRTEKELPLITEENVGLWPILNRLAREFPTLEQELTEGLKKSIFIVRARIQAALWLMASARLKPIEYVQEMRSAIELQARFGPICLPWSIAELMARLLGDDVKEVLDPAADASVLPAVLAFSGNTKAEGVFSNSFSQFFTTLQARILGASFVSHLAGQHLAITRTHAHCISSPPLGGKVKEADGSRAVAPYEIVINQIIERLAPGGRGVVLVPESMLFAHAGKPLRERLVREGLLSTVVSLPSGLLHPQSGIKSSIVVIERRSDWGDLAFIDAAPYAVLGGKRGMTIDVRRFMEHLKSGVKELPVVCVARENVLHDEHIDLTAKKWTYRSRNGVLDEVSADEIVPLGDLVQVEPGVATDKTELPYFQVAELASEVIDLVRTAVDGRTERPASAKGARMLGVPALLVARVGGILKPTVFDPAHGPIAIGSNIVALRVDEELIDPRYLALELRSGEVQEQVSSLITGSGVPSLSKVDMLRLLIRVPDKEEQNRIVGEQLDLGLFMERLKRSDEPLGDQLEHFAKLINKNFEGLGTAGVGKVLADWMQHEKTIAVRSTISTAKENMKMLRHQFNNRLGWVTTGLGNVSTFIEELIEDGVISRDMPIAPSLEGEEAPSSSITASMGQLLRNADQLPELFDRLTESLERKELRMEFIEMDEFFRSNILPMYEHDSRFDIRMDVPSSGYTTAYVDRFAMKQVITNIIDNAVKHGFTDKEKKYTLNIVVDDRKVIIANDGTPPSIDLDEMKLRGRSVGPHAGSGEGLYWADTLMQQMGGRLLPLHNASGLLEAPVSFAILIELPAVS